MHLPMKKKVDKKIWLIVGDKTIIDVLSEDSRFEALVSHLQKQDLVSFINNLTTTTLFAPVNKAFDTFVEKNGMLTQDLYHGQLLTTIKINEKNDQLLKITTEEEKKNKKLFVNQAQIITQDIKVNDNIYIQAIDQVLTIPTSLDNTLQQYHPYYEYLKLSELDKVIKQDQSFTVFVSKSDPLEKLNTIEKNYLVSKYGLKDLKLYFNYFILAGSNYAINFPKGKSTYQTLNGNSIDVFVNDDATITINDIPIVEQDILAANGVVHELKEVPLPNNLVFDTRKYLYGLNATKYASLFDRYGLAPYLDKDSKDYTFIVPQNDVIDEKNTIPSHKEQNWLRYHFLKGSWTSDILRDGLMLESQFLSSKMGDVLQRIPVYVENEEILNSKPGKSIQFDRARVIGDHVKVSGNIIYLVSNTLTLPSDMLSRLAVDLNLSTFIATLYVSKLTDEFLKAKGITLFVPTNEAFDQLGLIAKYLMHPSGKQHLKTILRYHVADQLLYYDDMLSQTHEVNTLANTNLLIRGTKDHQHVVVGKPNGLDAEAGVIIDKETSSTSKNIVIENGVVHKLNEIQIPDQVEINNYDILVGIGATTMLKVFELANMTEVLNKSDCVVLAPTEKAFAKVDLENLYTNPYQLERIAKFHLLKTTWQQDVSTWQANFETYLSKNDKLIIKKEVKDKDDLIIFVKDNEGFTSKITGLGKSTILGADGGVMEIDTVLIPIRRGVFGLPFVWSIIVLVIIISIVSSILSVCGFLSYKIYNRRRLGYRPVS
ncbi:FAS1 domain-containing protein [Cunninghamella echinulata]|nr:FAS1 domain-containing protein [Cunninghamella echinulata]